MKVGTGMQGGLVAEIPAKVRKAEELGYDFFATSETKHNPFVTAALAAEHAERAQVRTSIALGLRAQSYGHGVHGLGFTVVVRRSLPARSGQPGSRAHRQALQYALGQASGANA